MAEFGHFFVIMARRCELTGKAGLVGNTVSKANNKLRKKSYANLSWKRYYVPELKRFIKVRLSNRAIRSIDKIGGLVPACRKYEKTLSSDLNKVLRTARG